MTLIIFLVYLQGVVEALSFLLLILTFILLFAAIIVMIEYENKSSRPYFIASIVMILLSTLLPSQNTFNVLIGMQVTTEISETLNNSALGKKALIAINMKLDEMVSTHDNQK